jgi:hypothetical protein
MVIRANPCSDFGGRTPRGDNESSVQIVEGRNWGLALSRRRRNSNHTENRAVVNEIMDV